MIEINKGKIINLAIINIIEKIVEIREDLQEVKASIGRDIVIGAEAMREIELIIKKETLAGVNGTDDFN